MHWYEILALWFAAVVVLAFVILLIKVWIEKRSQSTYYGGNKVLHNSKRNGEKMTRQCAHCQKDIENAPEATDDTPLIVCSVQCRKLHYAANPNSIERCYFPTIFGARRKPSWTQYTPQGAVDRGYGR